MSRADDEQGEFDSRRSAKITVLLCCMLCETGRDEAELHADLISLAVDPTVARQLLRIFATNAQLAAGFHDVRAAAEATLRGGEPEAPSPDADDTDD